MNRNQIVNSEKQKLLQKRTSALLKASNTLKKLMQDEVYANQEIELRKLMIEITKVEIGTKEERALRQKYELLLKKHEQQLEKLGFKKADLVPQFECKKCNDLGIQNGKMCTCLQKNVQKRLLNESGLNKERLHTFLESDKTVVEQNPTLFKAYKLAQNFVENFPQNQHKNLVFVGDVGKGKTFLAECIASAIINKGFYVVYVTSFELNNLVVKTMNLFDEGRDEVLSPLLECDLLIIDDLGTEPVFKNFSHNNLYTIINQRQINNLSTIISTNLTPEMVRDNYGDRLFSRIFNKQNTLPILFEGKDLRINKSTSN